MRKACIPSVISPFLRGHRTKAIRLRMRHQIFLPALEVVAEVAIPVETSDLKKQCHHRCRTQIDNLSLAIVVGLPIPRKRSLNQYHSLQLQSATHLILLTCIQADWPRSREGRHGQRYHQDRQTLRHPPLHQDHVEPGHPPDQISPSRHQLAGIHRRGPCRQPNAASMTIGGLQTSRTHSRRPVQTHHLATTVAPRTAGVEAIQGPLRRRTQPLLKPLPRGLKHRPEKLTTHL